MAKTEQGQHDGQASRRSLTIRHADQTIRVVIERGVLASVGSILEPLAGGRDAILVTDETVRDLYADIVIDSLAGAGFVVTLHVIAPGEQSKSLTTAEGLYEVMAQRQLGRDATVVALGGGVVSDLAGFVAATWMRGVALAVCPTTLEADVDACLGGKTALNIDAGKNLVGAFHHPRLVAVDPLCLESLPPRDVRAGLAESIKHALISDARFLHWHESNADALLALEPAAIMELIQRNLAIKSAIVEADPTEREGTRLLLNFGHTIGHAIESLVGYSLRHGECVSIGIAAACRISQRLGMLDESGVQRVERLLQRFGLPVSLAATEELRRLVPASAIKILCADSIVAQMERDKKVLAGRARFVLLSDVGRAVVRGDVPIAIIRDVCHSIL